jgi:hypothetical protein
MIRAENCDNNAGLWTPPIHKGRAAQTGDAGDEVRRLTGHPVAHESPVRMPNEMHPPATPAAPSGLRRQSGLRKGCTVTAVGVIRGLRIREGEAAGGVGSDSHFPTDSHRLHLDRSSTPA